MKHPKDLAPLSPALPAVDRSAAPGNGAAGLPLISHPDPEVVARAQRRRFTADYKLRRYLFSVLIPTGQKELQECKEQVI